MVLIEGSPIRFSATPLCYCILVSCFLFSRYFSNHQESQQCSIIIIIILFISYIREQQRGAGCKKIMVQYFVIISCHPSSSLIVEHGNSAVECRTSNQMRPGSNHPLLPFRRLGIFVFSIDALVDSAVLKLKFMQYPAIHTHYSLSNCTISNKKDFNRSSDFLVIN